MGINKVFVYGTLMIDMPNHYLVKPFIKNLETAKTNGLLYDLPYGYPAIVDGPEEILGEIIELIDVEEALIVLDHLEGYYGEGSPGNLYNRTVRKIQTLSGKYEQAFVYLWARPETIDQIGTQISDSWRNRCV
ncbi:MAG: gamma-glutamylcyclotransferase family protein [Desulfitobacteriaceae bacterium]